MCGEGERGPGKRHHGQWGSPQAVSRLRLMHKSILAQSQSITYLGVCFYQKRWRPDAPVRILSAFQISLDYYASCLRPYKVVFN